jgi:hypothetical protein
VLELIFEISGHQPVKSGFDEPMTLFGLAVECGVDPYWMLPKECSNKKDKAQGPWFFYFLFFYFLFLF